MAPDREGTHRNEEPKEYMGMNIAISTVADIEEFGELYFRQVFHRYRKGRALRCLLRMALAAIDSVEDPDAIRQMVEQYDIP